MTNPLSLLSFSSRKQVPIVLQTEIAECGLACMAMVVSYHGHKIDLNTLRRKYPISLRGSTLHDLIELADKLEFACRPLRLELEEMEQLQVPTILHWDLNHFVVLKKATSQYIIIHDPAQGMRKLTLKEASKHFTGVALELTPTPDFKPLDEKRKIPFATFWSKMVGLKRALIQVFALSLVLQLFSLLSPLYVQLVIDEVVVSYDMHLLVVLALGFSLFLLIEVSTSALRSYLILKFSSMLSIQMATNLFRHLIRLPLPFFEKRHIGDLVSRFGSLSQIERFLTTSVVQAVVDGIMSLATLGMMLLYAPMLSLLVIVALIFYLMIRLAWYRPLRALSEETIVASAKENSNFMETLRGIQSIKLFNKEPQRQVMWQNRYADTMNASIRKGKLGIIFSGMNGLLFGLENILVVYMAAKMVLAGNFTIGMLYAFMSYKSQFTSRAAALIENFIEIKMLGLHLERLGDIALEPAEKTETWHSLDKPKLNGQITLENIAFKYSDNEPEVLSGIDFTVAPGESVAIIGPSGCGKTTLMKIMMGIFKPTMGQVLIDNQPLEKFGMQAYREQFGTVMQNDQLLSGSISENITFFSQRVDEQRLKVCTKMAMIDQDIEQMPMGYNTLIGDMGAMLSGGQQQRLLLARALYKAPTVLFLDEATSHLDVALEQAVNGAVKQLNITRIIIAHRPETIASADRVVLLTAKGLIEQNT